MANLDMKQNYEEIKRTRRQSSVVGDGILASTSLLQGPRATFQIDKDSDDEAKFGLEEAHIEEAEDRVRSYIREGKRRITLD